jgi:hypothetical protein
MPKPPPGRKVDHALSTLDDVRRDWLRRPGVTAVDVGFRVRAGQLEDELCVRAHVERKLPPEAVSSEDIFSRHDAPQMEGNVPVDVIEARYVAGAAADLETTIASRRVRALSLAGGISVGNGTGTAGTLGAIVWDLQRRQLSMLSNWHVLAFGVVADDPIYQPGGPDGGTAGDVVGALTRHRIAGGEMDAALAALTPARPATTLIAGIGAVTGICPPELGMEVIKSGRTTGVTRGVIDGISASPLIAYEDGSRSFHDQIHIAPRPDGAPQGPLTDAGDSGCVWINEATGEAVGLHFASDDGPPGPDMALANPMNVVAAAEGLHFTFAIPDGVAAPALATIAAATTAGNGASADDIDRIRASLLDMRARLDALKETLSDRRH